jgi:hypothetical protein
MLLCRRVERQTGLARRPIREPSLHAKTSVAPSKFSRTTEKPRPGAKGGARRIGPCLLRLGGGQDRGVISTRIALLSSDKNVAWHLVSTSALPCATSERCDQFEGYHKRSVGNRTWHLIIVSARPRGAYAYRRRIGKIGYTAAIGHELKASAAEFLNECSLLHLRRFYRHFSKRAHAG